MLKNVISPIQAWLLSQGRCVGCGKELKEMKVIKKGGKSLVHCTCRRVFVLDPKSKKYRRALLTEV